MKFHITIINNETGKTLVDQDTGCIIGACDAGEGTRCMSFAGCAFREKLTTAAGALDMAEATLREAPKPIQRALRKVVKKGAREDA
jgi:hypothetical protein